MLRSLCSVLACFVASWVVVDAATARTCEAADATDQVSDLVADAELIAGLRDRYTRNGLPPLNVDERTALDAATDSVMRRAELLGAEAAVAKLVPVAIDHGPLGPVTVARLEAERFPFEALAALDRVWEASFAWDQAPHDGPPFVAIQESHGWTVRRATRGTRPKLTGWRPTADGSIPTYTDVDTLAHMRWLPGGVAFGRVAQVDGAWQGLAYLDNASRLALVDNAGRVSLLPKAPPEVLKACFLFAWSPDPTAVSIDRSRIRVHPVLRDTRVGRDLVLLDTLPWALDKPRLPNGATNPLGDSFALRLASVHGSGRRVSLVTDGPTIIGPTLDDGDLRARLRVRYVGPGHGGSGVRLDPALGDDATEALPLLTQAFPAQGAAQRYAAWIALFRWALQPDTLDWIDLAALADVEHRTSRTPDFLCRGECAEPFSSSR